MKLKYVVSLTSLAAVLVLAIRLWRSEAERRAASSGAILASAPAVSVLPPAQLGS